MADALFILYSFSFLFIPNPYIDIFIKYNITFLRLESSFDVYGSGKLLYRRLASCYLQIVLSRYTNPSTVLTSVNKTGKSIVHLFVYAI